MLRARREPELSGDALANEWARARGVALPSEIDTGQLCGQRRLRQHELHRVVLARAQALRLRDYLAIVEARLARLREAADSFALEREALELQAELLHLRLDGEGMDLADISAAFGRRGHRWASEQFAKIREAAVSAGVERGAVGRLCANPRCPELVTRAGPGRPAIYCSDRCRWRHTKAVAAARARAGTIPPPGWARMWACLTKEEQRAWLSRNVSRNAEPDPTSPAPSPPA